MRVYTVKADRAIGPQRGVAKADYVIDRKMRLLQKQAASALDRLQGNIAALVKEFDLVSLREIETMFDITKAALYLWRNNNDFPILAFDVGNMRYNYCSLPVLELWAKAHAHHLVKAREYIERKEERKATRRTDGTRVRIREAA
jgi:hypothetical protein